MKKNLFKYWKKYSKIVFCYTLSSVIAFAPATTSLAASTETSDTTIKDAISSIINFTKEMGTESNDSTKDSSDKDTISSTTTEDIESEDTTSKKAKTLSNTEESSIRENSAADKKETDSTKEDSTSDKKETSSTKEDSTSDKKETSSTKEDSTSDKKETSSTKEDSTSDKKETSSTKEDSTSDKKETSSTKEDSTSDKKETSSTKEDSTSDKKETSSTKEDSTSDKKETSSTKEDSTSDKKETSSTKEDSTSDKEETSSEEKSSSKTEQETTKQASTTATTDDYTTVEDIEISTTDPEEFEDNELLVQFKTEISQTRINEITSELPNTSLKSYSDGIAVFTAKSKKTIEEDIEILQTISEISIIQPNYKYSFSSAELSQEDSSIIPNDTFFDKQWGLWNNADSKNSAQGSSASRIDINVLQAWSELKSNSEVIVAVLDTGVDYQHKDLKDHMWYNKAEASGSKNADDDNNGYVDDLYGWDFYNDDASICHYSGTTAKKSDNDNHGTRCAGIIAATANNNFGIAGVASNIDVKIMSLKVSGGPNAEGDTANIIKAIKYASYNGAKICNASWNCDSNDPALELAIKESNMLFICSAGNGYGTNIDSEPSYPCSYDLPNVIGVTSIDPDGTLSYFSNYGKNSVAMAAPGSNICSTIVGKYGYDSGTSMATPFVTGVAAMLYAYDPTLYPVRAKQILLDSTTELPELENKVTTGGMIDAGKAVAKVQSKTYKKDTTPPTITPSVLPRKTGAYLSISIADKGGSYTRIRRYAYGKQSASYFKNGEKGKVLISGTKPFVTTKGYYTIYAQDNAGNESTQIIKVDFDKTAPNLSVSYKKSGKYYVITIKSSDSASGLSSVRYSKDKHTTTYFKTKGNVLSGGTVQVRRSAKGTYSFYARDKAGNTTLKTVKIK